MVTRLAASPPPLSPPPAVAAVKPRVKAERGATVVAVAEELERARERRGQMRDARERTELEMDGRAEALDREAAEWGRRVEEQRRLVAELTRLIEMPETYSPVEPLRSREGSGASGREEGAAAGGREWERRPARVAEQPIRGGGELPPLFPPPPLASSAHAAASLLLPPPHPPPRRRRCRWQRQRPPQTPRPRLLLLRRRTTTPTRTAAAPSHPHAHGPHPHHHMPQPRWVVIPYPPPHHPMVAVPPPPPPQFVKHLAPPASVTLPLPPSAGSGGNGGEDNRTIWVGDLQYWMDENYLHSCFGPSGKKAPAVTPFHNRAGEDWDGIITSIAIGYQSIDMMRRSLTLTGQHKNKQDYRSAQN